MNCTHHAPSASPSVSHDIGITIRAAAVSFAGSSSCSNVRVLG